MSVEIPVDTDELKEIPSWATGDNKAKDEQKNWGKLDSVIEENDVRWLRVYGYILPALTIAFSTIFICSILVWAWHYIAPTSCLWLQDHQLSKIQSVLFSGGMGAVISGIISKQLKKV